MSVLVIFLLSSRQSLISECCLLEGSDHSGTTTDHNNQEDNIKDERTVTKTTDKNERMEMSTAAKSNETGRRRETDSEDDGKNRQRRLFSVFYVAIFINTVHYGQRWSVCGRCVLVMVIGHIVQFHIILQYQISQCMPRLYLDSENLHNLFQLIWSWLS